MKRNPLLLLIGMIVVIISMSFVIIYQISNAPPPPMGSDREGGIIFGAPATEQSSSISNTEFVPAAEKPSGSDSSCD